MSLRSRKPAGEPAIADQEEFPTPKPSLVKKLLTGNNSQLLHSLSYVAIDVQPKNQDDRDNARDENNLPFVDVDQKTLADMVKEKKLELLSQFGGVRELAAALETDMKGGVSGAEPDLMHRKNVFGTNEYQKPPVKGLLSFVLEAFKDPTIILLLVCAIRSLVFGIKQHGLKDGWYDGSIIVAVFLVVNVSALSNFKQSRQFEKLSSKSDDISVEVVRDGLHRPTSISIFDVVVGDLVYLKVGDQIPADGLFLEGHSLKVDESSMTGESDHIEINDGSNPFLLSGTKVTDGFGSMIVTSVGMNTQWGEMMSSISRDLDEQTPLQERLKNLTFYIGKVGSAVALLVLMVSLIRYFTGNTVDVSGNREFGGRKMKFDDVMNGVVGIVAASTAIGVVAIPEGLPLAVTLTLAYSMKKMMNDNALVRKLSACETMGSATTICTDKTGTLTFNKMKVTEFWLGTQVMTEENITEIVPNVHHLLLEAVGLNTTGSICKPNSSSPEISGSPTEKAILSWALFDLGMNIDEVKQGCEIIHVETFNSQKKRSGVLIMRNNEKDTQTHWKGAAEMILAMCANYYDKTGVLRAMDDEERKRVGSTIQNMSSKSLRCIAFAHRMFEDETDQFPEKLEEGGMTLLGLVGIKDPCRPGVRTAVDYCRAAGVNVKMITGDNLHTEERMERIDKISVMANFGSPGPSHSNDTDTVPNLTTIVLQLLMVEFLKKFASTERLDWGQWGACVGFAALSWPIGWLVKGIPVSGWQVPRLRAPRLLSAANVNCCLPGTCRVLENTKLTN